MTLIVVIYYKKFTEFTIFSKNINTELPYHGYQKKSYYTSLQEMQTLYLLVLNLLQRLTELKI